MNKKQAEILVKKYEEGLTSLEEEAMLFEYLSQHKSDKNIWFQLIQQHRNQNIPDLEENIWKNIQQKENKKKYYLKRVGSIAAVFILLISLGLVFMPLKHANNKDKNQAMTLEEKTAVLKEALAMFPASEIKIPKEDILYEDDNLIIYLR